MHCEAIGVSHSASVIIRVGFSGHTAWVVAAIRGLNEMRIMALRTAWHPRSARIRRALDTLASMVAPEALIKVRSRQRPLDHFVVLEAHSLHHLAILAKST